MLLAQKMLRCLVVSFPLAVSFPVAAQTPTIGFVHGFNSGAATWSSLVTSLHDSLSFNAVTPNLNWELGIPVQTGQLALDYGASLGASPFLVGHSAGGIVSREYGAVFGASGVLTIGSPHAGAPISENYPMLGALGEDALFNTFFLVDAYSGDVFGQFGALFLEYLEDWGLMPIVNKMAGLLSDLFNYLTNSPYFIVNNMQPSSGYMSALAQQAPLEPLMIGNRSSIVVTMDSWWSGGPWRPMRGAVAGQQESQEITDLGLVAISLGTMMLNHSFMNSDTPYLDYSKGMAFISLGEDALLLDPVWCLSVSFTVCAENDGFIPSSSQQWGPSPHLYNRNVSHGEETTALKVKIQDALTQDFGIPRRP